MTSAYLESDSEPELDDSDTSSTDLPITDICSPSKKPRLTEASEEEARMRDQASSVSSSAPLETNLLLRKPPPTRPPASPTLPPSSPVVARPSVPKSPVYTRVPTTLHPSTPTPNTALASTCPRTPTSSHISTALASQTPPAPVHPRTSTSSTAPASMPPSTPTSSMGPASMHPSTPISAYIKNAVTMSPSPSHPLLERHEKELRRQSRLTKRVEEIAEHLKTNNERRKKLAEFRSGGGIRGLSRTMESTSSEDAEEDSASKVPDGDLASLNSESSRFPFPLCAPGLPLLLHPPRLITELYPPGLDEEEVGKGGGGFTLLEMNIIKQHDPEVLTQLICQRWFLLCYRSKPCPRVLWEWLFQIMCLSCDCFVAERAYANLITLVEWSCDKGVVFVPAPHAVLDVLVSMGADKAQLESASLGMLSASSAEGSYVTTTPPDSADDVFQPSPPMSSNLSNLLRYLSRAVSANPAFLSTEDVHQMFLLLAYLSLDSSLTRNPDLLGGVSSCLSALVASLPEGSWDTSLPALTSNLVTLSSHHHDRLHLTRLLLPTSLRMKQLQKAACKQTIWRTVFPDMPVKGLSDSDFLWTVVKHYYETPAVRYEYYSMYTVVCLLTQLLHLSSPEWPSSEKRRDFRSMLSKLASVKIRDSADSVERAPVKDLLISMALEMASQRPKDTAQTNLFDHFRS